MPRSPQTSSTAISTAVADRGDPTLPVILEYQSPSTAIVNAPIPRVARGISWTVGSMVLACFAAMAIIKVDKVVTAQGKVIAQRRDHRRAAAGNRDRSLDRGARGRDRCMPVRSWPGWTRPSPPPTLKR